MVNLTKTSGLKKKNIALLGCGDIGNRLGALLLNSGASVTGYRRHADTIEPSIDRVSLDFQSMEQLRQLEGACYDYVIVTLVPDRTQSSKESAYRVGYVENLKNILSALNLNTVKKLFWVSSTSVYSQNKGEWIDETSLADPKAVTAQLLLEAEQLLQPLGDKSCIVRFAGIYRGSKHRLLHKLVEGVLPYDIDVNYYSNRIHADDCAGVLNHLIALDALGKKIEPLYLGVDSEPIDYQSLVKWLSLACDLPLNKALKAKAPVNSKRISNQRLLSSGYEFIYPSFRQGFRALIEHYKN